MLRDTDSLNEEMSDVFWDPNIFISEDKGFGKEKEGFGKESAKVYTKKKKRETELLESFYRDRFWRPMLRRNRLEIYACRDTAKSGDGDSDIERSYVAAWDAEAISELSLYLSKRKLIGQYQFKLQERVGCESADPNEVKHDDLAKKSYICVGAEVNPFSTTETIPVYLNHKKVNDEPIIKQDLSRLSRADTSCTRKRGFERGDMSFIRSLPISASIGCTEPANQNCRFDADGYHTQPGLLLLWREKSGDGEYSFRAYLAGVSGPATRALSTLFVDEAQKDEAFRENDLKDRYAENKDDDLTKYYIVAKNKWDNAKLIHWEESSESPKGADELSYKDYEKISPVLFPLSTLQEKIRDLFLHKYREKLKLALEATLNGTPDGDSKKEDYITRVTHTASLYLSGTLYRYFFPFLSDEDEERICNGMHLFIRKMAWNSVSPFAGEYSKLENANHSAKIGKEDVNKAAIATIDSLRELLKGFQAVETLYEVPVDFKPEKNTRRIHSINLAKEKNLPSVRCIFK